MICCIWAEISFLILRILVIILILRVLVIILILRVLVIILILRIFIAVASHFASDFLFDFFVDVVSFKFLHEVAHESNDVAGINVLGFSSNFFEITAEAVNPALGEGKDLVVTHLDNLSDAVFVK